MGDSVDQGGSVPYIASEVTRIRGTVLSDALAAVGVGHCGYASADARVWATILKAVPLFSKLGSRDLRRVAQVATVRHVPVGEAIVREGYTAEGFYVLLTGRAVVRDGKAERPIERGEWFGELGLLDGAPRTATVVTATKAWLMMVPRPEFLALLDRHASIGRGIAEGLAVRLRELQRPAPA
jgi:CRP-like cAMP-binding protein